MSTEKNNQKKGVFEILSAEEAKKIRAYSGGESLTSGDDGYNCPSGTGAFSQCQSSHEGAKCCYYDEAGNVVRGVCVFAGGFGDVYRLKCSNLPWEIDP